MKKLPILLCYLFISFRITAQKTSVKTNTADNFCNTLSKVIAQAPSQFEKLKTGGYLAFLDPVTSRWVSDGWVASIYFPGAFLSNIEQLQNGSNTYNAYFGNYQSEADGRKEIGIIKNKLSVCLPGFAIEDRGYLENNFQGFPINFYFIEKKKGIGPQQIVNLYLGKDSSIHSLHLRIFGSDVNGNVLKEIMKKPETQDPVSTKLKTFQGLDFDSILKDIEKTNLGKQLLQLLDYTKDGFKTIKGEKIEESKTDQQARELLGEKAHVKFKTDFLPDGAERSEIRFYADSTKFIAWYGNPSSSVGSFKKLFEKIKKELGNDFTYEADDKSFEWEWDLLINAKAVFYRKNSKQPSIELLLNTIHDIKGGMPGGVYIVVKTKN